FIYRMPDKLKIVPETILKKVADDFHFVLFSRPIMLGGAQAKKISTAGKVQMSDIESRHSYDRLVNNSKRSLAEMLSRASLGDNLVIQFTAFRRKVLRVARKAYRSVRLSCALGRQRDAFLK